MNFLPRSFSLGPVAGELISGRAVAKTRFGAFALCCGFVLVNAGAVHGQPPVDAPAPPALENTEIDDIPEPIRPAADPRAEEKIQRVLEGDQTETASGMLGDVLEIIRGQGSVLDGSVLDEPEAFLSGSDAAAPPPILSAAATQKQTQAVETAEALLRTARMLESLAMDATPTAEPTGQAVPTRRIVGEAAPPRILAGEMMPTRILVEQMRIQATRLLLSEFPQASRSRFNN